MMSNPGQFHVVGFLLLISLGSAIEHAIMSEGRPGVHRGEHTLYNVISSGIYSLSYPMGVIVDRLKDGVSPDLAWMGYMIGAILALSASFASYYCIKKVEL
jgi:hypothetical protein